MKFLLIILLSLPLMAWAVTPVSLPYQAQVTVRSQESKELNQAFTQALHQVLIKLTGAAEQIQTNKAKQQIGLAERYVESYRYLAPDLTGYFPLRVDFDPQAIDELIKTLNLTTWKTQKPVVLSWIWTAPDEIKWVITPEDRPTEADILKRQADSLDLPIIFPLMDIEDRRLLNPESLANLDENGVRAIMDRYGVDAVLIGQVQAKKTAETSTTPTSPPSPPISSEKTALSPLEQAAQVRENPASPASTTMPSDPAMSNLPPSRTITPPADKNTNQSPRETQRKPAQWLANWQLYVRKNTIESNHWENKSGKDLGDTFAAGLASTLQHLAQQQQQAVSNQVVDAIPATPVNPNMPTKTVQIVVTGIHHLQDYTAVKNYLIGLALVQAVNVHNMTPNEVTYELLLTGDETALQTAIGNGRTLIADSILPGVNFYRYQRP